MLLRNTGVRLFSLSCTWIKPCNFTLSAKTFITALESNILPTDIQYFERQEMQFPVFEKLSRKHNYGFAYLEVFLLKQYPICTKSNSPSRLKYIK